MPAAAVGVDDDGVDALEGSVVIDAFVALDLGRPTVGGDQDLQAGDAFEAGLEEHHPGSEFMHSRGGAGASGDEENRLVRGAGCRGHQGEDRCQPSFGYGIH